VVLIAAVAVVVGIVAALLAEVLSHLIGLITNLVFYGRFSLEFVEPAGTSLGGWVVIIPIIGALVVGVMARFGSSAIRGHGIPEVMQQIIHGRSRIPLRLMFLKPLSAAVAIGTGGPFGAEGPIIATGGALGSVVGQIMTVTADERKTLLAAGAAAGMTATFGSPVAAVLLAVELLLFEYHPRSVIPVALAVTAATGVRLLTVGSEPVFQLAGIVEPGGFALASYVLLGAIIGLFSVYITRIVYAIEDAFERLPIHWMWWPALGAVAVGVIGLIEPRTLGVGYENIQGILSGTIAGKALLLLILLKFISWSVYLGSGTSGGTLAPLFTIGGGIGAAIGWGVAYLFPELGIDPSIAALVGMAAIFAGASHALLASIVFAFEVTRQPIGLLPLLGGCSAAYLISLRLMRHSIMTERLARRGTPVRTEYTMDYLAQVQVGDAATRDVVTLNAETLLGEVRQWLAEDGRDLKHQGYPVISADGLLVGVVTLRDLLDQTRSDNSTVGETIRRAPVVVFDDNSMREAADHMVRERVGRLPVVTRNAPRTIIGIISRSDLLGAHEKRLESTDNRERRVRRE
jgi:H+/Cl- antiporter ClcA/CBS domain-containing protein